MRVPKRKTNKARVKQWLTFDLLPLHLEGAALGLDSQLEALDGLALVLEGYLLVRARNAEHDDLALGLGELGVPIRQGLPRHLVGGALLLQRCTGIGEGGLLLLEPFLSPLAGGALLQEPLLSGDEGRGLGVEGGLQVVSLLGALLQPARPLLSLALLRLRPSSDERSSRVSARTVATSASQLAASVRVFSKSERACHSASSRSMRAARTRSRLERRAVSCLELSGSSSG
jgi:hypothetical protein